ncbi:hypothetical protein [Colwellia psychrerythraea]|uniref:Uncharacterized protein n=1 Tax=Colwellia psychrerythraea TaxID=28229 RepID=A0A099KVL5_COLPS|nr:hypothetical protein [Colwellia psychrerythraea]KGJ94789.1 hypothetical protein GAB14E_2023 [Colwellia psychrerythraea]
MTYVYLKDIFLILIPFILSNLVFQYFYQTNILKVTVWWFKYHNEIDHQGVLYIGLFFTYIIIWASTGSIINKISWALHGEKNQMIYVGDISKNEALLYPADNLQAPAVKDSNISGASFSFNRIYKKVTYLRDKGSTRLGLPSAGGEFSWRGLFSTACFIAAFTPVFFALMHSFAYIVSMQLETMDFYPDKTWQEAWVNLYNPYGITLKKMMITSCALIFGPIVLFTILPSKSSARSAFGERVINLPMDIRPSNKVMGLPIESYRVINKGVAGSKDTDSGYRVIIFKFKDNFPKTVYVSLKFDSKQHPELEKQAENNIKHGIPMKVIITDNLGIELVNQ